MDGRTDGLKQDGWMEGWKDGWIEPEWIANNRLSTRLSSLELHGLVINGAL